MYGKDGKKKATTPNNKNNTSSTSSTSKDTENKCAAESSPKWEALKQVLDEIKVECDKKEESNRGKILVCASDERTCNQLRQILCQGTEQFLQYLVEKNETNREVNRNKKDANEIRKLQI